MTDTMRGIILMTASMAGFAFEDMFVKLAAETMKPGQILVILGFCGGLILAGIVKTQGHAVFSPALLAPPVMTRNISEMIGAVSYVTALALAPLSTVSAILQAMPLAVTFGAALFLGEVVGWRRWTAIFAGFLGVIVVLRPGLTGFQPAALWAVVTVVFLAARDLATRQVDKSTSSMQLAAWGFLSVGLVGLAMMVVSGGWIRPSARQAGYMVGALAFGLAAYWAVIAAMRVGEVSTITPFRYSRLIFALILGIIVFGEHPDLVTLGGAALIIGSGLYAFARERLRARAAARATKAQTLVKTPAAG